jgi:hypothetical protein
VAIAANETICSRASSTIGAPEITYRMPLWPLPPVLAIAALGYITTKQTHTALRVTGITALIGLVYWAVVIWPQRGRAWNLKAPIFDRDEE